LFTNETHPEPLTHPGVLTRQAQGPSLPDVNQGSGAGSDPLIDFIESILKEV